MIWYRNISIPTSSGYQKKQVLQGKIKLKHRSVRVYVRIFNLILTQQDEVYFDNASLTLDLLHNMSLNNIPLNNIIIVLNLNTTLITISNFLNIILKSLQRNKLTFMKNNIISNNSNNWISSNFTICYITSSNSTNIWYFESLSNFSITNNNPFIADSTSSIAL